MEKIRAYVLYDEEKIVNGSNIGNFDFRLINNAIGIHISDFGAFGVGGLVYVLTENGKEYLFNYYYSEKVWNALLEHFPMLKEDNDNWVLMSNQVGWRFFVRKDYKEKLLSICEDYMKNSQIYKTYQENGKVSKEDVMNNFIIPQDGPILLYHMVKGEKEHEGV